VKSYYVYILSNKKKVTLYIGVTSNLLQRLYQHKYKLLKGFTSKYSIDKLVYFEEYNDVRQAIYREKKLKAWNRTWKIELIEKENKEWNDLSMTWIPAFAGMTTRNNNKE